MLQPKEKFLREFSRRNLFSFLTNNFCSLGTFKHNASVTKLVNRNIETAALLVYQTYPVVEHFLMSTLSLICPATGPSVEGLNRTCGFKL